MNKSVEAEYLAEERVLKLAQPLDGFTDHEHVSVLIERHPIAERNDWPQLDEETGRDLARAVRDAFGRDELPV